MQALHKTQQGKPELEIKHPGEVFCPDFAVLSTLPEAVTGSELNTSCSGLGGHLLCYLSTFYSLLWGQQAWSRRRNRKLKESKMKNIDKKRGTQIEISSNSSFPGMLKYLDAKMNTCRHEPITSLCYRSLGLRSSDMD